MAMVARRAATPNAVAAEYPNVCMLPQVRIFDQKVIIYLTNPIDGPIAEHIRPVLGGNMVVITVITVITILIIVVLMVTK